MQNIKGHKGSSRKGRGLGLLSRTSSLTATHPSQDNGGITVSTWEANDKLEFSCWDFSGETLTHSAHQIFLSSRSIYIIVFNVLHPNYSQIEYWLQQIELTSNYISYIILVGTHSDESECTKTHIQQVTQQINEQFISRFYQITGIFVVSNSTKSGIQPLVNCILNDIVRKHTLLTRQIPGAWHALDQAIQSMKSSAIQIVRQHEFESMAKKYGITFDLLDQTKEFLRDVGTLVNFHDQPGDSGIYVIDPMWLSDVLSCLFDENRNQHCIKDGILLESNWQLVWHSYPSSIYHILFKLLETFDVVHPLPGSYFLFPPLPFSLSLSLPRYFSPSSSLSHSASCLPLLFPARLLLSPSLIFLPALFLTMIPWENIYFCSVEVFTVSRYKFI